MPRDNQRQKLYDAERDNTPRGREFKTIDECQRYVDHLIGLQWFKRRWGIARIECHPGFGHRKATGGRYLTTTDRSIYGILQLPKWSRHERVILHEVAHCLTPGKYATHGKEFAATFLALYTHQLGKEAGAAMRKSFLKRKVKHRWTIATRKQQPVVTRQQRPVPKRVTQTRRPRQVAASRNDGLSILAELMRF